MSDGQWAMVSLLVPSRRGPKPTLDDRTFIDAVLYRARTGVPWRDLPERFGSWKTIYTRFRTGRCAATGRRSSRHSSSRKKTRLSSSMHPLFEPTRMLRAEKGDHQQCFGSLSRWVHHESPRARRPQRAAAPHRAHARAKARVHRRRRHHREARAGQSPDRRHRIRLGRHSEVCSETSESRRSSMRTRHERTSRDSIASATRAGIVSRCSSTV